MNPVVVFFAIVGFLCVSVTCGFVFLALLGERIAHIVRRRDDHASAQHIHALRELADLEDLWSAS